MATSDPEALRQFTILEGDKPRTGPTWKLPDSQLTGLITGHQTQGNLVVFEQTMTPNGGVPLHINHREDESFYILEGKYLFDISGILNELGPRSCVFVPRGIAHRFLCVSETPGRMLITCQPAGIEAAFDELASLQGPIDLETFKTMAQKYGVEVLGPPLAAPKSFLH